MMLFYIIITTLILSAAIAVALRVICLVEMSRIAKVYFLVAILAGLTTFMFNRQFQPVPSGWLLAFEGVMIGFFTAISTLWMFYRDPHRTVPQESKLIVAPAEGRVRAIHIVEGDALPVIDKKGHKYTVTQMTGTQFEKWPCYHIAIEMNILDVHVNRIPIDGRVVGLHDMPGPYFSLRNLAAAYENRRVALIIENDCFQVGVIQISSRMVRRIVNRCKVGQRVKCGERYGMIRFGSQVDILFPVLPAMEIRIKENQRVRAGETILACYQNENEGGNL